MSKRYVPINKGNYSMDTPEREAQFEKFRGEAWEVGYSEYRKNWSMLAKTQIVSDYPLLVDLELASICNLKCPMCYTITDDFKKNVNTKFMNFELFKRVINEISGKVPALRLSLRGEATLHPNFVQCIEYAKNHDIKEISTLTHGGRLKIEFVERIIKAGIDWITISVDGVGAVYERIRKPIKFAEILENIKEIKRYKDKHCLNRPVIKVQGIWPAVNEDPVKYYETFAPYVDLVAFNPLIDYLGNDTQIEYLEDFTCPQQYQRLVIGADGLVMKCSNDEENREVIGDIKRESVYQVWHGEKMQQVREMQKRPCGFKESQVCRKCYLPRKTINEIVSIDGRNLVVPNYVNRIQQIGK